MTDPLAHSLAQVDARLNQLQGGLLQMWRQFLNVRRSVARLDALDRLARAGRQPRMDLEFRAQFGEDVTAWELLGKPLEGFFIEVGAFDGVSYSTTHALEALGWTGLLVEPIPARAEACRRNRPHARVVHSALAGPAAAPEATFHVLEDEYGGMLSYAEGLSQGHHVEQVRAANVRKASVRVPVTTLDRLLDAHRGPIDLVTIDVEGAELELLAGFDLARFRPRVVFVEDSTFGNNPALDALMARAPYQVAGWVESSRVYVRADEPELVRRAREVL